MVALFHKGVADILSSCSKGRMERCYSVTVLQCYSVTLLQCYSVTVLQCYSVTVLKDGEVLQCYSVQREGWRGVTEFTKDISFVGKLREKCPQKCSYLSFCGKRCQKHEFILLVPTFSFT